MSCAEDMQYLSFICPCFKYVPCIFIYLNVSEDPLLHPSLLTEKVDYFKSSNEHHPTAMRSENLEKGKCRLFGKDFISIFNIVSAKKEQAVKMK